VDRDSGAFALAQELLTANKALAPRRTIEPGISQGIVSCSKCGYALYRSSGRSTARKVYYYRCLGSDAWRHLNGPICTNRPIRQDLLDQVVWSEIIRLLENPRLIDEELNRRLEAAQKTSPTIRRQEALQRDLTRVRKSMERLMTAYQEDLLSLDELRSRMPELRQREKAMHAESQSIATQAQDRATYLRLAETLSAFLTRLRTSAETLDVLERNGSSVSWSRRFWSATTRSSFAIPSRSPPHPGSMNRRNQANRGQQKAKIIFCVQGVLSPILANVLLDEVDKELEKRGHAFVRYADDLNIYVRSKRAGERVMEAMRRLYARLKLRVNEAKSAVARATERKFLGFSFWIAPGRIVKLRVAPETLARMREHVRTLTRRVVGRSMAVVCKDLGKYLAGWKAYFRIAETPRILADIDKWVRHRLRALQLKHWKRGPTIYRELRARGMRDHVARQVAGNGRRWWHNSAMNLHMALPNKLFDELGVPRIAA
jgi:hypothetical protein